MKHWRKFVAKVNEIDSKCRETKVRTFLVF